MNAIWYPILLLTGLMFSQVVFANESDSERENEAKPNIVIILADDMGYGDLGCYNADSKIKTPNLDQMAKRGMRFTDAHSGGSSCIPSRYSLLTGEFALRMNRGSFKIRREQWTLATLLKKQGYRTAMVGKWHLGFEKPTKEFDFSKPFRDGPVDRGFDSFFGMHASLDIQPYFFIRDRNAIHAPKSNVAASSSVGGKENWNKIQGAFWRAGKISEDFEHEKVTPRFIEESAKIIREHAKGGKADQPLFLYVALPSPHTPWLPTKEFRGRSKAGMYGDFMMQVDDGVGQILKALKDAEMENNTLVMFSSDNGPVWYDKDVERFGHRSSGKLRGMKFASHEGGHRMPFMVRWPDKIKAETVCKNTMAFADVFATLADIVGQEVAEGQARDSVSFYTSLLDPKKPVRQNRVLIHDRWTVRIGDYKLILPRGNRQGKNNEIELFDLRKDLSESKNIAEDNPEQVQQLKAALEQFRRGL